MAVRHCRAHRKEATLFCFSRLKVGLVDNFTLLARKRNGYLRSREDDLISMVILARRVCSLVLGYELSGMILH